MAKRFTFPKPSEEMQHIAALLEAEVKRWPQIRTGKMFGMVSLYRNDTIFALLPATRSLATPTSIMIKPHGPDALKGHKWQPIEVQSQADIPAALRHLEAAYSRAK